MNDQNQIIAIAEACGWTKHKVDYASCGGAVFETFWLPDGVSMPLTAEEINSWGRSPMRYTSSLDAMAQAEEFLSEYERREYIIELGGRDISWHGGWGLRHAKPAELAIAFLKAKKLWRETP